MPDDFLDEIAKLTGRPFKTIAPTTNTRADALKRAADKLGVDAADLGSIISFETGGTLDPHKVGGEGNKYKGLIQFGPAEQKKYYNPKDTFETQVENGVVRYFQDRFKQAGKDTRGATLEDLYTTVIAGNPKANRNAKDSFGTSARSGTQRILKEHRPKVLKDIFGGALPTAQTDDLLDEVAKLTGRPFGKRTEPTNPVNTIPQSSKVLPTPVPETQTTLTSQMASLMDPASTRIGVLLTPGETPPVDLNPSKFRVFDTKNGAMVVNLAQAKKFKLRNPADIQGYLDTNPNAIAQFTGKVETNDDTGSGFAVVTYDKDGNEIHASKVTSSAAAIEQAKLDKNNFKDGVSQKVIPAQKVVEDRNLQLQREEIQKNALPGEQPYQTVLRLRREPAETAYKQFLTDTGLTDSDESRKEFSIAQNASIEGANRQNQADVAAYNAQLPKQGVKGVVGGQVNIPDNDPRVRVTGNITVNTGELPDTDADAYISRKVGEQLAKEQGVDPSIVELFIKAKGGSLLEGEAFSPEEIANVKKKRQSINVGIRPGLADDLRIFASQIKDRENVIDTELATAQKLKDEALTSLKKNDDGTLDITDPNAWTLGFEKVLDDPIGSLFQGKTTVSEEDMRRVVDASVEESIKGVGSATELERLKAEGAKLGTIDKANRFVGSMVKTILKSPATFAKTIAWAEDTVEYLRDKGIVVPTFTSSDLLRASDWVISKTFGVPQKETEAGTLPMMFAGTVEEMFKDDPVTAQLASTKFANAIGSAVPFLVGATLSGGSTAAVAALGIGMQVGEMYDDAKKSKLSREKQLLSGALGIPIGASEVLGLKFAKLGEMIQKRSGGVFVKSFLKWLTETGKEATEETLQEFFQSSAGDVVKTALKTNNLTKRDVAKALGQSTDSALTGGIVGAIFGGGIPLAASTAGVLSAPNTKANTDALLKMETERAAPIKTEAEVAPQAETVKVSEEVKAKPQAEAVKVEPQAKPKPTPKAVEPQVETKPSKYRERISELAKELNLKKGTEQPDAEAAPSAPSDVSTTEVVDADVAVQASRSASLRRLKKIADFTTDEGKFANYDIDKDHRGRADMFVVLKDPNGYIVRNAFVPDAMQRSGLATELYQAMNTESLKKTGKPLRSTQPRTLVTGEVVHELTPDSIALWDSFVKKGVAEKLGDKDYRFLPTATKAKTPKAPVPTAPKQEGVKEPWEMTQGEWLRHATATQEPTGKWRVEWNDTSALVGDPNWAKTPEEILKKYHAREVRDEQGNKKRPVPAEVLAEYPELTAKSSTTAEPRREAGSPEVSTTRSEGAKSVAEKPSLTLIKSLRDLGYSLPMQKTLSEVEKKDIVDNKIKKKDYVKGNVTEKPDVADTPSNQPADVQVAESKPERKQTIAERRKRYVGDVEAQTETTEFKAAEAKAEKETPSATTGYTKTQTAYIADKLKDYAKEYPQGMLYGADTVEIKQERFGGGIASHRSEELKPETIAVPADGTVKVTDLQQANRLHQRLTGKPLTSQPKEALPVKQGTSAVGNQLKSRLSKGTNATNLTRFKMLLGLSPTSYGSSDDMGVSIPIEEVDARYLAPVKVESSFDGKNGKGWVESNVNGQKAFTNGHLVLVADQPFGAGRTITPIDSKPIVEQYKSNKPVAIEPLRAASITGAQIAVEFGDGKFIKFEYYNLIKGQYPNATFKAGSDPNTVIGVYDGKNLVGLIMPLRDAKAVNVPANAGSSDILRSVPDTNKLNDIIDDRGNIDYGRAKDVAGRILSGKQEIRRLSPEGERGRIAGGRRNVEASLILGASQAAIQKASPTAGSGVDSHRRQEGILENYAKRNDIWFKQGHFPDRLYRGKGGEANVYQKDEARVIKLVDYRHIDKSMTPLKYLDTRISLFNALFPESHYELAGFMRDDNGTFRIIVTQPLIQGEHLNSPDEVNAMMKARGLDHTEGNSYANSLYEVHDLHKGNVVKADNGTIYVIDAVPKAKHIQPFEVVEKDEDSILKKTRTTDAMDELETLKQARDFAQIVPKVESSVEDGNVVYLKTSEASEVMRTLISVVEGTARDKQPLLQGLFLTPNRLTDIKDALSALIDESDIDTKPLKSLLSNIEKAETKNGAIKLKVFDEALPHEEAHESSWLGSKGKPYVKRYANADKITSYEPFKRFKQELELRMGMKVNDGVALEEALAYLGTGDLLGVNIDEATEILALLVEGYAEANGVESLKNFKPGTQLYEAIEKRTESQSSKGSDGTRSNVSEGRETGRETATAEDQGDAGTEAGFDKASGRDGVTPGKSGLPFDRVEAEKARKLGQKVAAFSRIIGHEYYYDPQNREATDTKAAQLVGKMGVSTAIDQALNGKPSAEGMRVVYWELERLAAQVDAHLLAGRTAEAASVATRAAELAAAIVQRQVAAGQEVEIGKTLATLSPESALIVASRMVRYATKDGKLSTKQSEATVKLANELRKEKAKLAEARLEIAKQRAKIRRLENDRPARKRVTSQDKLLKDYKSREGAILAKLREAFPNSPMFNGSVLRMVAGIRGVQNLPDAKVRQNNYVIAKSMDEAGLDAKRIWLATGWEKGKDGKWRNEIDDSDATLRPSSFLGRTSLGELLDFPEMFKAYPNLRNVTVTFEEKWSPGTRGALGKDQDGNLAIGINANLPMLQVQSTLLHEVQHAIQSLEGFARGGGVEGIPASYKERRAELYRQVGEYNDRLSKLVGKPEYESVMSEKLAVVRELQNLEANADSIVADSEDRYNRLAGEVEARNVQLRHYMTPAERAKSALSETEDVPRDKQIVRYGDGVSQSILRSVPDNGVRDALVEYAIGQILQNRTYEAVIGELQDISGLTTEQVKSIHASAVEVLRPARTSSDTAQADIRRIRQEHYKQAKAIDQNIDKKIDPAFKKKWNQNVRELGPIAQEAMKQFPDDTDLVMAVERLTGKSPKNINDVVKDLMGGGRSVPDATQLARKANSLVKAIKEQRAADKAKAEGKLQEALLSEREARIAAQKKAGELRKFLANLAADPNVIKRFNNDFRAKVVLNWGTQIFNGVQAMTIATPAEFALDVLEAGLRTVGVNVGDNVDMSPSLLAPWYVFATDRQMAEDALSHFPEAFYQLHAGLMGDIEIDPRKLAEEKTGLTKYAHKYFDANERLNEFLAKITGAKLQEMHFRNAQILTIFDGVIRSKTKGQESLKSALEHGTFTKYITEKEAQYAVDRALRVTMASQIDDPIGKQLKQAYDWLDNYVPVILNPVTFARFTYTASKVTVINPIMFGAMDSAKLGGQGYNNRSIAKGVLAWSGIAMAYGLQSLLGGDDDKWYTLYIFGKDKAPLDIRRFYPVSAYFYMAHLIRNFKDGRPLPSKSDLLAGFASLELDYFQYGAPMQALSTAGELWGGTKDWGDLGSDTAAVAASWFAGSTRFFKPMKDVLAQAWDKEAAMREYDESTADKVMKELGKSLPVNALYGENFNVPIKKDMKGNDVITPFPLARMIGVNIVHPSLLSKEDSVATEWANRLFPYTGSSSRMTLEERKAYNARKAIRNAVRSGQDVDIEGVLRNMNAKLSDKSLSRLKAELKHSELGAKIKFDFGDNKKDIEALKRVWRHATPSEKDEINSILRDKYKKKSISRDTLDMFDVNK